MAEGFKGQYAPELFNEEKRYYLLQAQEFANLTDSELRDMHQMSNTFTRRFIQTEIGDSAVAGGFKIIEHPTDPVKNFLIQGGDGTLDNPGVIFLKGYRLALRNSIGYKDQTSTGSITDDAYTETVFPVLTDCSGTSHNFFGVTIQSNKVLVVGDSAGILKSTDLGKNFSDNSTGTGILFGTTFSNATNSYAVGFNGTRPIINYSTGGSWTDQYSFSAFPGGIPTGSVYGISFIDLNNGFFVGSSGQIYFTDNGGLHWIKNTSNTTNILRSVGFFDINHGWAVGDSQTILKFDGANWLSQTPAIDGTHFYGVTVLDATTAVLCGTNGVIQETVDGINWLNRVTGTSANLSGVCFSDPLNVWAVGDSGVVLHSMDKGTSWNKTVINPSYNFKSVFFKDATTGFIVGNSGAIYRTLDATVWDLYRTDYAYVDFHLAEVSGDTSSEYYDSTLIDPLIGMPSANRLRIVQDVKVSEGWPTPSDYTTAGPDGTVIQHYTYTLAKIHRSFDSTTIQNADIIDARGVVRTIEELDYALKNGGVDSSSLAAGSITPDKLVTDADFTVGSLQVLRDATIAGDLRIEGMLYVEDYRPTIITDNLVVKGSSSLGDSVRPYDSSTSIYGPIIQGNDTSRTALDIHSYSTTGNVPVINILQDGSGSALKITQTGISTLPLMDVTSTTGDYDISIDHNGKTGGVLRSWDDSTKTSFLIRKDATQSYAPVFDITTNAYGPAIAIHNTALCDTASIGIDQSSGSAITIKVRNDASSIVIDSTSSGTDLRIMHGGSGYVMTVDSSGSGVFQIQNNKGIVGTFTQKANADIFILNKDSTGSGRALEINHSGIDPAAQINNVGQGIGLHVSHVGDSSSPAVDVYVAGAETGPAVRIRKANNDSTNDVGQALYVINQGFSEAVKILQDNTDSTSALLSLVNYSNGYDASGLNWHIDKSGNFFTNGDVTTSQLSFDSTFYLSADRFFLDSSNFDSTNPFIAGRVFQEDGFLRISDGTTELPPPGGFGKTGLQGMTGINGLQGVTGLALGATGIQGVTGFQGPQGNDGQTGIQGQSIQGMTGLIGSQGAQGQTGIKGVTGISLGQTGIQGVTGVFGQTGIQGVTGMALGQTGVQGVTGIPGIQGVTGLKAGGFTGVQGVTGFHGIDGQTGIQGLTGFSGTDGQTGIQGLTGFSGTDGQTGIQGVTGFSGADGQTGIQGVTGLYGIDGQTGIQGMTGLYGIEGQTGIQGFTGLALGATGIQGGTGIQGLQGGNAGRLYYFEPLVASDIPTYFIALPSPSDSTENTIMQSCADSSVVLIGVFATDSSGLGVPSIPPGTAYRHIHGQTSDTTGVARYQLDIYRRDDTTETLIRSGYSDYFSGTSISENIWSFSDSTGYPLSLSSRIIFKLYATRISGSDPLFITTYFDGSQNTSFVQTTISVGSQGLTGLMGPTGLIGSTGLFGQDGQTGIQGVTGIALGQTGIQGVTGIALGQTGIQGVTGILGVNGQTGIQGFTGIPGVDGHTGIQGVTGLDGEEGPQGSDGQTGIQGMTGIPGVGGQTGIQGMTGIPGVGGQTGIQGVTGIALGQTGIQGVTGLVGQGTTGFQGLTGLQAPSALSLGLFAATDTVTVSNGTTGIPVGAKLNGKNLTDLLAVVATPGLSSTTDVTIRRRRAGVEVFMLTTASKISGGSYYSNNGVINPTNQQVLLGDMLFVDVTNTNTTAPLGLSVVLTFDV